MRATTFSASLLACLVYVSAALSYEVNGPGQALVRRADGDGDVGVNVTLPPIGLALGNISTKLGNINLTVTDVTVAVGNIEISDIHIGDINVIVSVPLPGASPIRAFSVPAPSSLPTSSSTSTSTSSSTPPAPTSTTAAGVAGLFRRQDSTLTVTPTTEPTSIGATATATVSAGDISLGIGSVNTEIGDIDIFVGHVNVSVGNVNITNVSVGNILVYIQIGQPDLAGIVDNLGNAIGNITDPSS